MIIKSHKEIRDNAILGFIVVIGYFVVILVDSKSILWALGLAVLPTIIQIRGAISQNRTFIFNENGIEVSLFNYKTTYLWNELEVKQLVDCHNALGDGDIYERGALFSPRYIHRPKWMKLCTYGSLFHPWSLIFINFYPQTLTLGKDYAHIYAVDEKLFIEKMTEWGVELEEVDSIFSNPK